MKVLIVEDDSNIAKRIDQTCVSEGFSCYIAENGIEALEMVKFHEHDVIILDLMLPDIDGFEVLSRIRYIKNETPIIILSGLNSTEDKVKCLSMGADDYLTKPFSKAELLARINAVIRRTSGHFCQKAYIGPLEINFQQKTIKIYGEEIYVTKKEYAILELLILKKGSTLPKEAFLGHIYGGRDEPEVKIIDVFICKLRKKLADLTGGLQFIETVWGQGYTIKEFEDEQPENIRSLKVG